MPKILDVIGPEFRQDLLEMLKALAPLDLPGGAALSVSRPVIAAWETLVKEKKEPAPNAAVPPRQKGRRHA